MKRRPDQLGRGNPDPRRRYAYQVFEKVGRRRAQAIAKVGLAVTRSDGRLAGGGGERRAYDPPLPPSSDCSRPGPPPRVPLISCRPSRRTSLRSTTSARALTTRTRVMARVLYHDLRDFWGKPA